MAENIGATARAMSNFGLSDLRLVAPRAGANGGGWPHGKALEMAAGAEHIVRQATLYSTLPEALDGITRVYATSARPRAMEKRVVEPETAAQELHTAAGVGHRCAILFGAERTGLENDEMVLADVFVNIPTDTVNSSLNLAQPVVIMSYAWHRASLHVSSARPARTLEAVSKRELQGFFDQLEGYLDEVAHFRTPEKKTLMWQNLKTIFVRTDLSSQEVQSLRGTIKALYTRRKED